MINLEIVGRSATVAPVADVLDELEGVSGVRLVPTVRPDHSLIAASVRPGAVDATLAELRRLGVPDADITLIRVDVVGRAGTAGTEVSLVWADVLGQAWLNARPLARYIAFMLVAGVVACYGVIDRSGILIVGAMAVSPDLLPITAAAVGVVGRRAGLSGRALLTLALGMTATSGAAAIFALAQDRLDLIPSGFDLDASVLGSLTTVNDETIVVALVAGVAAMLALETRASSGVGVAISVTTIPAAAYLGVAAALGEIDNATGALGVLGMNVAMLVLGASVTLALQRAIARRGRGGRRGPVGARS